MPLYLTNEQAAFRDEVRQFLDAELTANLRAAVNATTTVWVEKSKMLAWQQKLSTKGWAVPHWPVAYGGTDWTPMQHYIFEVECARAGAPELTAMGVKMVGPVIVRFGSDAQRNFYLPRIISGEDFWCQGFSEPGSGSDLASLQCRADRDGDDYVINGSKIWTTDAHHANRIFVLVRTKKEDRPQKGISFILVDMATPGVTVTPILSISGDHEVNQVFFENVRVPSENLVGEEGAGWTYAKYLLGFERGGSLKAERLKQELARVERLLSGPAGAGLDAFTRAAITRDIARVEIQLESLAYTEIRVIFQLEAEGGEPGPEASILKVEFTEILQRITELAMAAIGPYGAVLAAERTDTGDRFADLQSTACSDMLPIVPRYFNFRAASIYGGSNEVQRNIIAKAALGLPA